MNGELLRQVRILDPVSGTDRVADVSIAEGQITAIAPPSHSQPDNTKVINCQDKILAPGLTDLYSHSGEPGYENRETLASLAAAALAGGFTRVALLPDTLPVIDTPSTLEFLQRWQQQQLRASTPHFYAWGAISQNLEGKQMTELAELAQRGAIGFADGYPLQNWGLLRRFLEYAAPLKKPIALVATNKQLKGNGIMREGQLSVRAGLAGDPAVSETAAIASLLEIVAATGTLIHLMRISTARGVELIAEAKERGLPLTASTSWMYLLLDTEAVCSYDPHLRLEPPLGNIEDRKALIQGVKTGVIDAIAVDHAPYTYEEKTVAFAEAPPGAIGLELALPLLWDRFVETGEWTAVELWRRLSSEPQRCLGLSPIRCAVGEKAELVLFDPHRAQTVNRSMLHSLSANTPWFNKTIRGRVLQTWLG
ncbi:MAG: dihydroorotase [Cyanobacteriota bacterium]|nr:dihydroorotase [Cyanobacteriota bacterium]